MRVPASSASGTTLRVLAAVGVIACMPLGRDFGGFPSSPAVAQQRETRIGTVEELRNAIDLALPGDTITFAPGTYNVNGNIRVTRAGTSDLPIVVRAEELGEVYIKFDAVEGFHVLAPYWTFENLDIEGGCPTHSECEHAFHIVGSADGTIIRGNRLHEYNAMIKGNGSPGPSNEPWSFPDDVVIEYNELFNITPRYTDNPVTPIDVVGGRRWIVRGNFIYDHAKAGGNGISYAAFLKGNSRSGTFERNLVVCELLHQGQIRLGLSFGGGGSSPDRICEDGACSPEHQDGVMSNNIIVNCPADVGIYLNEAARAEVSHNTLFNTAGIDVRFDASSVELRNNLLTGRIRNRDGGTSEREGNLEGISLQDFETWFQDPDLADFSLKAPGPFIDGPPSGVREDFCTRPRDDGAPDIGAVEYASREPCHTQWPYRTSVETPSASPTWTATRTVGTSTATAGSGDPSPTHASPTPGTTELASPAPPAGMVYLPYAELSDGAHVD